MPNITKKSGLRYYTSLMKGYFEELFNIKVDSELNFSSKNPVRNSVVTNKIDEVTKGMEKISDNSVTKKELTDAVQGVEVKVMNGAWLPVSRGRDASGKLVDNAIVHGQNVTASGVGAHAEGLNTTASGSYSHAEGVNTTAAHRAAHAEGNGTVASQPYTHAEGAYNYPLPLGISMVGVGSSDSQLNARVIVRNYGEDNNGYMYLIGIGGYAGQDIEDGMKSLQEVIKDHETDIAGLKKTMDMSQYSTTGDIKKNLTTGEWLPLQPGAGEKSIIIGNQTTATGQYAFASGLSTQANGMYSHAEGVFSIASGNYSHAEGSNAKPKGEYSHAEGERTEIASQGGHAEGVCTYLNTNEDVIHHVGVGYYNDQLSTDVILRKYGDAKNGYQYMIGIGGYNGKDITSATKSLQEVIKELGDGLAKIALNALADRQSIANNTTAIATANTRIDSATTRLGSVESSLNAMNATRLDIITMGGSADEPVPVWTDSTRHDITQKKRIQTFTGFTNIEVANGVDETTIDRLSWISAISLSNFHGTKLTRAFYRCGGIKQLDTRSWDTSAVTSMRSTFHGCVQLAELDVSLWDTHSVTDMGYAFCNCSKLTWLDTRSWDTSAVTSMDGIFSGCSGIEELDLSGWDTSHVTTIDSMFNNCGSLRRLYLRYWDLSHVSSAAYLFNGCGAIEDLYLGEGFGKVLDAVGTIDFSALTKWTGDSVQTLLYLYNRTAHSSDGYHAITLRLSSQTKAALGTAGIQTLTSRGYTIA